MLYNINFVTGLQASVFNKEYPNKSPPFDKRWLHHSVTVETVTCTYMSSFNIDSQATVYYELLKLNKTITGGFLFKTIQPSVRGKKHPPLLFVHMLRRRSKPIWEVLHTTRRNHQRLLLAMTAFGQWHMTCLRSALYPMKIPKISSIPV